MSKIKHKILQYPAVFESALEGGYNASFPSFPVVLLLARTLKILRKKPRRF